MNSLRDFSVVTTIIFGAVTCVWAAMQILGWDERRRELRPDPNKLCYALFRNLPLPRGCVVTNSEGREVEFDAFSRFKPLPVWSIGTELHFWGPKNASGDRSRLGVGTLTVHNAEWVRIEL